MLQIYVSNSANYISISSVVSNIYRQNNQGYALVVLFINQEYAYALQYVENQTEELCKLAVQKDWLALQYVKEQTEEICKLAVQEDEDALQYVDDKFIHLFQEDGNTMTQEYRIITNPHNPLLGKSYEEVKEAIRKDGECIGLVNEQTEELCKLAVQQNVDALRFIKNQTEELCKLAVKQDWHALHYVKNQTEELCKIAVKQNKKAAKYVDSKLFKVKIKIALRK